MRVCFSRALGTGRDDEVIVVSSLVAGTESKSSTMRLLRANYYYHYCWRLTTPVEFVIEDYKWMMAIESHWTFIVSFAHTQWTSWLVSQ